MRILFVKLGSIGDVIHTLPSLAAARAALPEASISWVVESRSAEILRENPLIDNLIEIDTRSLRGGKVDELLPEIHQQVGGIRKIKFDVAIDFQGLLKSAVIAKLSGAKKRYGFSRKELREPVSRVLLTNTVKTDRQIHVILKNLQLLSGALDIAVPSSHFEFPVQTTPQQMAEASEIIEGAGDDFAILNPAGGWVTKLWHAEKFGELADKIWEKYGMISVVATGPAEIDLARKVEAGSNSGKILLRQPTLKGFYELAKKARIYIGGDTGPTHLAIAAGAPVVGIFGPTEWWRNGSPIAEDICVERKDIACRIDCHRRTCNNWICMDISVDTVFEAVAGRLAKRSVKSGRI
jgi:heptosyltransferase-1